MFIVYWGRFKSNINKTLWTVNHCCPCISSTTRVPLCLCSYLIVLVTWQGLVCRHLVFQSLQSIPIICHLFMCLFRCLIGSLQSVFSSWYSARSWPWMTGWKSSVRSGCTRLPSSRVCSFTACSYCPLFSWSSPGGTQSLTSKGCPQLWWRPSRLPQGSTDTPIWVWV